MRLQLLYQAVLLTAASEIFVQFADPIAASFMVGMILLILGVEILDGLGIIEKVFDLRRSSS